MLVFVRRYLLLLPALLLPVALTGCTRTAVSSVAETKAIAAQERQEISLARQQMELIPPPSKARYMAGKRLALGGNPYLTGEGGRLALHVVPAGAESRR